MPRAGTIAMLPAAILLLLGFAAPVGFVVWTSLMPPRTFALDAAPTLTNYVTLVLDGYWRPFAWSLGFALATTAACLLIAWPIAKALVRHAGRFALVVSVLLAVPIFIAESVRLFGAFLFLMPRGGILAGSLNALFGWDVGGFLNTPLATVVGLIYVHLPFAIFPMVLGLAQVPHEQIEAARDLGASGWQVVTNIEIPVAMPGILIGAMLVFVLALGATTESTILGGQAVTVVGQSIEQRFNYAQDWPLGSALATILCLLTALIAFPLMRRLDIDRLLRR